MRAKKNSERLIRLEALRERERRYLEAIGFPVRYGKGPKPPQRPRPSFEPDFWDLLNRKKREYEAKKDKGMLAVLEDIRHFATKDLSNGSVPLWLWNWLKYIDVAPIHWSESAECEEGEPSPEDEYNGVEEDEPWWNGGIEMPSERLRKKPVVRL